ncbi:MAG TPA: hypothetical protein VIE65_16120 [Methylobacter sp.]
MISANDLIHLPIMFDFLVVQSNPSWKLTCLPLVLNSSDTLAVAPKPSSTSYAPDKLMLLLFAIQSIELKLSNNR